MESKKKKCEYVCVYEYRFFHDANSVNKLHAFVAFHEFFKLLTDNKLENSYCRVCEI